jgi:hypothetical protein
VTCHAAAMTAAATTPQAFRAKLEFLIITKGPLDVL